MSEVTFTTEQIREIHRRINAAHTECACVPAGMFSVEYGRGADALRQLAVLAFPFPKVTRYRTFTPSDDAPNEGTYRMKDGTLEYWNKHRKPEDWSSQNVESVASYYARQRDWTTLAALADVAARPTEEVNP